MNKFRRMSTQINTEKKFRQKATDSIPWVSLQKGLKEDHERMTILIQSYGWLDKQRGKKVFGHLGGPISGLFAFHYSCI